MAKILGLKNLSKIRIDILRKIIISLIFNLLLFLSNNLYAQVDCVEFPLDPDCQDGGVDAPIDSGVGLLIGAAAFYTIKKIRDKKDNFNQTPDIT